MWVADERDALGDRLQGPAQAQPRRGLVGRTPPRAARGGDAVGRAREVEEVRAFGLVELQRPGQGLEDPGGCAGDLAALEAGVVLDAEPSQRRDLAAAQSGHPPAAGGRKSDLIRGDASATSSEELAHFLTTPALSTTPSLGPSPGCHRSGEGCPASTPINSDFQPAPAPGSLDVVAPSSAPRHT